MTDPLVRFRGLLCALLALAVILNSLILLVAVAVGQWFSLVIFVVMLGLEVWAYRYVRGYQP